VTYSPILRGGVKLLWS